MKVFLHIGLEKTGTTTIQRTFVRNKEYFESIGFRYPVFNGEENHVALYNYSKAENVIDELRIYAGLKSADDVTEFRKHFRKDLVSRLGNYEGTVVFSNEHLSSRLSGPDALVRLKDLLSLITDDVTVVLYLRNVEDFVVSTYSTAVKCGETKSIGDFCQDLSLFRYQFDKVITNWSAIFGAENLVIREFSRSALVNGDIFDDFASVIGMEYDKSRLNLKSENESLTHLQAEFLRRFNMREPLIKDGAYNKARGNIVDVLMSLKEYGGKISITQADHEVICDQMKPMVERMLAADKRVPAMKSLYLKDSVEGQLLPEITEELLCDMFAALWGKKCLQ
ncbi:MAG: hypothetical protein CMI00_11455 [Oceanospirillaceae bacterium]|nr:hypothetical protein [Oceanospirillaceae bacterium]|tara:strand:- start:47976 stop:48986 length:1011 start_codon:yes stop_codon:yes gene_type:complete